MTPERRYFELGRLIAEMPDLDSGAITPDVQRWLANVNAVVKFSGSLTDALQFAVACENLDGPLRARNVEKITGILHRALTQAERGTPREMRGSIVLIGPERDAYVTVRQLLGTASTDVLLVDPGATGKVLADYAALAPLRVTVRVLADEAQYRPTLVGGARRWQQRFGDDRSLMVRLARAHSLYERLVILDRERAWVLGVPFSDLAKMTHTTLVRMRPEEEARKLEMYDEIWDEAQPLSPGN
jgi:hypothetical protein